MKYKIKRKKNSGFFIDLIAVIITGAILFGYVNNIVKFCKCDFEPSYKAEIIHGIGIVSGIGVITGYLDLGK